MDFTERIRQWVAIDNRIKKFQEEMKQARVERNQLATSIIAYADTNDMGHAVIEITDGKLKFQNARLTSPLTFKFINQCLTDCIQNTETVEQIMKYIKDKREIRYTPEIKRFYSS